MTQTKTQPSQGKNKMAKKRRRRKKGGGGNNNSVAVMTLQPGEVPTDEQLEAEAKALEKELDAKTQKKFDDAKKDGLDLASLQALSGSELADIAKKEKIFSTESDVEARIVEIARREGQTPTQVREYFQKNDGIEELRTRILEENVRKFLRDKADIKEEAASADAAAGE